MGPNLDGIEIESSVQARWVFYQPKPPNQAAHGGGGLHLHGSSAFNSVCVCVFVNERPTVKDCPEKCSPFSINGMYKIGIPNIYINLIMVSVENANFCYTD